MPTQSMFERYCIDPEDGLRSANVGAWASEKHLRLRRYVDITRATRRKWNGYGRETSYIDLYCGPGRARIKGTNEFIQGSALVAATEAANKGVPFDKICIGDLDGENVDACAARLQAKLTSGVTPFVGSSDITARKVVSAIDPKSLHIALLDPFNIGSLPFTTISTLAQIQRMDLIIHVSTMDLQRNLRQMMQNGVLETFAPGWSDVVDQRERNELALQAVFRHWRSCLAALDYKVSDNIERVSGSRNQPLYWLVLASRNELADKFWAQVSHVNPQQSLPL